MSRGRAIVSPGAEPYAIESRPPPWSACLDPRSLVRTLVRHRDLVAHLVQRNVTGRYQGAFLGVGWTVLQPLLMLAVYTYVFGIVFRARWRPDATSQVEFALTLFCGLIPFGVISETAAAAPGVVVGHAAYVKRVVFPLELLPVVLVGTSLFFAAVNTGILIVAELLFLRVPPWTVVLLPLAALPVVFLALAVGWFLAALGVFVRDTASIVGFVMQLLFFATPILYPPAAVPEQFRPLVYWNPLAALVDTWRGLALAATPVPWLRCTLVGIASLALALGARALFVRAQRAFADVV
jgi:lipopolysaccharide transport system permease protein